MSRLRAWLERFRNRSALWIVQHDETAHNTILGVFADGRQAMSLADDVQDQFENGVVYGRYKIGYRFDGGSSRYHRGEPLL
jgi:hypothetical protein